MYIYIYINLPVNVIVNHLILGVVIERCRKRFQHPLLTSKPATTTQSA